MKQALQKPLFYALSILLLCTYTSVRVQAQCNFDIITVPLIDACSGVCTQVIGGTPPYTYAWSTGETWECSMAFGTYSLTVTDASGCSSSTIVTSFPTMYVTLITTPSDCGQCNGSIEAVVSGGGFSYSYAWSNGATTNSISNVCEGTYAVTVTELYGCEAAAQTILACSINYEVQPSTCNECNGSIDLGSAANGGILINVGNNGGTQTILVDSTGVVDNLCAGTYYYQSPAGGGSNTNIVVPNTVLPIVANAQFSTNGSTADTVAACVGQPLVFATESLANVGVLWDFGNPTYVGNNSTEANPTYAYTNAGNYTVQLIAQGCQNTDTLEVMVVVSEGIAPSIACVSLSCPNEPYTYTTAAQCDNYNWQVVGGTITSANGVDSITVVWDNVNTANLSLTVGNCNGSAVCNPTTSIDVPILSNNLAIQGETVVCANSLETYSLPLYGGVAYQWYALPTGSATIVAGQGSNQVSVHWNNSGSIVVQLSSDLITCNAQPVLPVVVRPSYSISSQPDVCGGATTVFTASAGNHNWTLAGAGFFVGNNNNTPSVTVMAGVAGSFTVTATNNTDFCNAPQSTTTNISPTPAPPQLIGETIICPNNGYLYQIAAPTADLSYQWTVTGGTPATAIGNDLYVVWQEGQASYQISAVAIGTASPFCTSPSDTLNAQLLALSSIDGNTDVCSSTQETYQATPNQASIDYQWSITPATAGSVISGQGTANILVQWNSQQSNATLSLNACGSALSANINIHTAPIPSISQSADLCEGSSVLLQANPNNYAAYIWQDGSLTNQTTADEAATYIVTVTDNYGCTAVAATNVHAYPLPNPFLSASDFSTICANVPTNVDIHALVSPGYSYDWFLDGVPMGETNASYTHIGGHEGSVAYTVLVTTQHGCTALSNPVVINEIFCPPLGVCPGGGGACPGGGGGGVGCNVAVGSVLDILPQPNYCTSVVFDNPSTGYNYVWNFGDGSPTVNTATNTSQTHNYPQAGFYETTLYATFDNETPPPASCTFGTYEIVEIPLNADFDVITPCINSVTNFVDASQHIVTENIVGWQWDFGDGTSSTEQNPTHTYTTAGDYVVTLVAFNTQCSATVSRTVTIHELPDADFGYPALLCQYNEAAFLPNNNTALYYAWDFGDGATAANAQAAHTYLAAGNYAANLLVTDVFGCENTAQHIVNVEAVNMQSISPNQLTICEGSSGILNAPTTGSTAYIWNDGSTSSALNVSSAGSYTVTVTQTNGCTYSPPEVWVNMAPLPPAQLSPADSPMWLCNGASITLSADAGSGYSYAWADGGNGGTKLFNNNNINNSVVVTVTVTDPNTACSAVTNAVTINEAPDNTVSILGMLQLCEGQSTTLFTNHPDPVGYLWNTNEITASITAHQEGLYAVTVTDTHGCTSRNQVVVNVQNEDDLAGVPNGCYTICNDQFTLPPYNGNGIYQWLHEGVPMTASEVALPIDESGVYQLQITSNIGCVDTSAVLALVVNNCDTCIVSAQFSYAIICGEMSLTNSSTGNGTLTYVWDFGDGTPTTTLAQPNHTYANTGTYTVCLTTTNTTNGGATCNEQLCQDVTIANVSQTLNLNLSCATTTDTSITWAWNNLASDSYTLTLPDGTNLTLNDTSYTTNGLLPNQSYTLSLSANGLPTCSTANTATQTCTTNEAVVGCPPPSFAFSGDTLFCSNDAAQTYTVQTATNSGVWSGAVNTNGTFDPASAGAGTHNITYNWVVDTAGLACAYDTTWAAYVSEVSVTLPADTITYIPNDGGVTLLANGTSALNGELTYTWWAGDTAVACNNTPCNELTAFPTQTTLYTVIATDIYGCTAQAWQMVQVRQPNKVIIPNAFSPNNSAPNNLFRLRGINVASYQLRILNRWGQRLYDSGTATDLQLGWDGTYNNHLCPLDVYAYFVDVSFTDGSMQQLRGNVTLIR